MITYGNIKITSLEDLVEIFPNLTMEQIMNIYKSALSVINAIDTALGCCAISSVKDSLLGALETPIEIRDFCANFLAQWFCEHSCI